MVKAENKIHTEASKPIVRGLSLSSSSSGGAASSEKGINKKKYKGVRMRSWGSWVSEIRAPNQKTRIWLGSYSTAEAAARAYDAALLCLKGSSANLNFPSTSSLYINQDITPMSPKSIQRVAAAAANTFVDNNNNNIIAIPTTPSSPPSPPLASITSSSNSSLVSSPSIASSPSDQIDDDVSLLSPLSPFGAYTSSTTTSISNCDQVNESMAMMEAWYGLEELQSPKYVDQMLSGAFFDIDSTHLFDDLYEESDIRLWSFS